MFVISLRAGIVSLLLPVSSWALVVTSFSPASGQPGNVITINGSGFSSATQVEFNNVNPVLGDFNIVSDSQLQVVVPLGVTTGPLAVYAGATTATSSGTFYVAPLIDSFSPASGTSPTVVSIQGANFVSGGTLVRFSGVSTPVTGSVVASTEVNATIPAGAVTGPITVSTVYGTNTSATNLTVTSGPSISGFSPTSGPIGTSVVIEGANFFSPTVYFDGVAASATTVSTTQITATVPSGASTGAVKVSTSAGSATTSSNFFTGSGPVITGFSPAVGPTNTAVTLSGFNLASVTSVTFDGTKGVLTSVSADEIQAYVPWHAGTGVIAASTSTSSFTTPTNFTVISGPYVTDFSPTIGPVGATVTIDGLNFTGTPTVKFNGTTASAKLVGTTQISATVPSGATTGPIAVTDNGSTFITSTNFDVTGSGPVIDDFTPTNGVRGATVTINGGNFNNVTGVSFNGVASASFTATSTTELSAVVPPAATTGPITVSTSGGSASSSTFFYLQPWITALSTNAGIVNAVFYISGRSLTNASSVQVNGVNYVFSNAGPEIAVIIPSNAISGYLTLTAPGGLIISTNIFDILPEIYSFTPNIGPAGTTVTISGTSLFEVTNVLFGGAPASSVFNVGTNQLQATVPAAAVTGPITVLSPYGNDASTNSFIATKSSLLRLTKTVSPPIVGPGTNVTYTLQVTNSGPSIVTGVVVTDNIPSGFTYVSSSGTRGSGAYSGGTLIWNFGSLTNNTSASFFVTGTALEGAITNTAYLGFNEGNLNTYSNFAFAYAYFVTAAQEKLTAGLLANPPGIILTWPQSAVGFQLQTSTNLASSKAWQTAPFPVFISNGLNTYTDVFDLPDTFYRLEAP